MNQRQTSLTQESDARPAQVSVEKAFKQLLAKVREVIAKSQGEAGKQKPASAPKRHPGSRCLVGHSSVAVAEPGEGSAASTRSREAVMGSNRLAGGGLAGGCEEPMQMWLLPRAWP